MKKLLIFTILIFTSSIAQADWYIISRDTNRCVSITQYEPDRSDLETRNEVAVYSKDNDIKMSEAEMFNGKIQVRIKSQSEKNAEIQALKEQEEMAEVYHEMFRQAYIAVKTKNPDKEYKHLDKHIDGIEEINANIKANK